MRPPPLPLRKNQSSEDLLRDSQVLHWMPELNSLLIFVLKWTLTLTHLFNCSLQVEPLGRFHLLFPVSPNLLYQASLPSVSFLTARAHSLAKPDQPTRNPQCPFHPTTTPYPYLYPLNQTPYLLQQYGLSRQILWQEKRRRPPPHYISPRQWQRVQSTLCIPNKALLERVTRGKVRLPVHNLDVSTATSPDTQTNLEVPCDEFLKTRFALMYFSFKTHNLWYYYGFRPHYPGAFKPEH